MDKSLLFCAFFCLSLVITANCYSYEEDTKLTKAQAAALEKLKKSVVPKLKRDFEKDEIYLLQFLRAKQFDPKKAEQYLLSESQWRTDYKMDTIHSEDFSDMEREYPFKVSGLDNKGQPILYMDLGIWDIRKAVLGGKGKKLVRWFLKLHDEARIKVREEQLKGKKVTRYVYLVNMDGANGVTNVEANSMPIYVEFATGFVGHYPNLSDTIYLIKTPALFEVVLTLAKQAAPPLKELLDVKGHSEAEWKPVMRKNIKPATLPKRYGGDAPDEI